MKNHKGFTLVELIVTLTIVGILAAILVPTGLGFIDKHKEDQCLMNRRSLLEYWESDKLYKPGETLGAMLDNVKNDVTPPGSNAGKKRSNLGCPSGSISDYSAEGEGIKCSIHGDTVKSVPDDYDSYVNSIEK